MPRTVMRPGFPGPAPIKYTVDICVRRSWFVVRVRGSSFVVQCSWFSEPRTLNAARRTTNVERSRLYAPHRAGSVSCLRENFAGAVAEQLLAQPPPQLSGRRTRSRQAPANGLASIQ